MAFRIVTALYTLFLTTAFCYDLSWLKQSILSSLNLNEELLTLTGGISHASDKIVHTLLRLDGQRTDPEVGMNVSEIIRYHGYPEETYTIPTEDGFLLGVQRIPRGRQDNTVMKRPVVFLQHGLLSSSFDWVANLPNESLAFILADTGFDVWLGNTRGNTYSRRHKTLHPNDAAFWAWSWDEHASLDLPAMLRFTLKVSGASELYYIGHSQGTLIGFAQFSHDKELSKKVKLFFGLAPVITATHVIGAARVLSTIAPDVQDLFSLLGIYEFLPNDIILDFLARTMCNFATQFLCKDIIFLIAGYDTSNFNQTRLPVYVSHTPAGTSVQNIVHFSQWYAMTLTSTPQEENLPGGNPPVVSPYFQEKMVKSSNFQMYDYGCAKENKKKYGQPTPPRYYASNVDVPVILFSGDKDWLADVQDVATLVKVLPNLVYAEEIQGWNHLDFIWGVDAANVVYRKVINFLKKDVANSRRRG